MAAGRTRLISLATALALALSFSVVGPVAAEDTAPVRDKSAEWYALKLLNCTRTGGWVKANGKCLGKFSGKYSANRKPLRRHRRISNRVAYPWARTITVAAKCEHGLPGKPGLVERFQSKGLDYWPYGENIGCGGGDPRQLVLATHRMMQAEKSNNGGHWKNIKNGAFKSVGIGVATTGNVTMVVYDFYGKLY